MTDREIDGVKIEYLEHTADAKFKVAANSIESAFDGCGKATMGVMIESKVQEIMQMPIEKKAKKLETLLYDFIDELLFLLETEYFLFSRADIKIEEKDEEFILDGILHGDDFRNYELNGDVKAMTYNDMEIKQTSEGYEIVMVVDI